MVRIRGDKSWSNDRKQSFATTGNEVMRTGDRKGAVRNYVLTRLFELMVDRFVGVREQEIKKKNYSVVGWWDLQRKTTQMDESTVMFHLLIKDEAL